MKKLVTIIVTLCLFVGITGGVNQSINAKESSENYTVEENEYSREQKEQLKNANRTFSAEELKNTPYAGHQVEIKEGELYVDDRIVGTIAVWILSKGAPTLIAFISSAGFISYVQNYPIKSDLFQQIMKAWNRYTNMTDAYAQGQKLKSFKLSNGNECVPISATTYACKYSV